MVDTHAREPSRGGADVGHDVTLGATRRRQCLAIEGLVQGVGFRPFVFGLAKRLGLRGTVSNVDGGVLIDIDGAPRELGAFRRGLESEAPPLARIDSVVEASLPPRASPTPDFQIVASGGGGGVSLVSPDVSLCGACRREMRDPADRRYGYAFINCTDCGPRFTIVTGTPYDRPLTTMADFVMCPACRSEYEDPASRRFHAQPVACPECGPRTLWRGDDGAASGDGPVGDAAVAAARTALAEGKIVAVKGIGGFHLACDATADAAVAELRRRKGRPHKPLAVMVKDLEAARRYAEVSAGEAELLGGAERPIVLLAARSGAGLAPQVAPGQGTVGLMLPYSPLHELLLGERPLVMTSGNLSGEPIVKDFETARARLGGVADGFLDHDRPIHTVCDDSVVRRVAGGTSFLRRSRGYAPSPLALPREAPPLLAVGGELKSVFCLAAGRRAFLSQHLGDVASPDTLEAFERAYVLMRELFDITPEVVACDLHPGYLSSQWAAKLAASEGLALRRIQHHHAHVASLMAEHGLDGARPVLGFAFDGTGYGADGTVWGGEALTVDASGFERVAHLRPVALPGGDRAVRQPARLALAYLHDAGLPWRDSLECVRHVGGQSTVGDALALLRRQLDRRLGTVVSSSMGRLFDAVAALVGVRQATSYEGQAAIELEVLAASARSPRAYRFHLEPGPPVSLDPRPVLEAILGDLRRGVPPADIADGFHRAVARAIFETAARVADGCGGAPVGLTGGVFQNERLLSQTAALFERSGLELLWHRKVPTNDGGLAFGQAALDPPPAARPSPGSASPGRAATGAIP